MLNLIVNQYQWIHEIERNLYGLQWAIKTFVLTVLVVGIIPSFFSGLMMKKKGFIYGCLVAFVFLVLYVFVMIWVLKTIAGGIDYDFTYTSSQEYYKMATYIIAGGFSVIVGGFMGLVGGKLRGILKKNG